MPTQVFVVYTPKNALSGSIDWHSQLSDDGTRCASTSTPIMPIRSTASRTRRCSTDSSFVVNGRIAIADIPMGNGAHVTVSLWSRNLLDETHIYRRSGANAAILGDYGNFNAPRTFGGTVAVRF